MKRGDFVQLTADGRTVRAMVTLASANGRSLFLMFDAMLGQWAGGMPVSLDEDDVYRALDGMPVTIVTETRH